MAIKINPVESSDDYFSDEKTNNIPAMSFMQQDPLNVLLYLEELEDTESDTLLNEDIDAMRQV